MRETMTTPGGAAAAGHVRVAGDGPSLRGPAYLVAVGGVLVILRLPVLGGIGPLLGMGFVLAGTFALRGRATGPTARRQLAQAGALAVVVTLLTAALELAAWRSLEEWVTSPGALAPAWMSVATTMQAGLGVLGTGLLAVALAGESAVRGWSPAADAWWSVTIAIVLVHGPILAAVVIVQLVGRPGGVHGVLALGLFTAAVTPYLLMVRAGAYSGPEGLPPPERRGGGDARGS